MSRQWFDQKNTGWKLRAGFYLIIGGMIFEYFNYNIPFDYIVLGFALMILGIGHKISK